jgi:orotate phosphoribosyltransferase
MCSPQARRCARPSGWSGRRAGSGVVIALDRRELGADGRTAVQAWRMSSAVPVISLLTLEDVIDYLDGDGVGDNHRATLTARIRQYQEAYCAR